MKKRLLAMLLAVVLVVALLPLQSQAAEARASRYLTYYGGSAATGASSGQVKVTFTDTTSEVRQLLSQKRR